MLTTIHSDSVRETADYFLLMQAQKGHIYELLDITASLSQISGRFFWLPVFNTLIEVDLFDKHLTPSSFMLHNKFAVCTSRLEKPTKDSCDKYYLTDMGYDYLCELIKGFCRNNSALAPSPNLVPKYKYFRQTTESLT